MKTRDNLNVSEYEEYVPSEKISEPLNVGKAKDKLLPEGKPIQSSENVTSEFLKRYQTQLVANLVGVRGDNRSPDEILPKCDRKDQSPHLNLEQHRYDSNCSGFVSFTRDPRVAHDYGKKYGRKYNHNPSYYYTIGATIKEGLVMLNNYDIFPADKEVTVIGSPNKDRWEIKSFRKCENTLFDKYQYHDDSFWKCGSIFIKKDLPIEETNIHIKAHRTNTETKANVQFNPKKF